MKRIRRKKMNNKGLTLTIIANITSNYGEGLGNISSVQKVYKNGKTYAIRSKESMKNAIMVQSGMYDDLKIENNEDENKKSNVAQKKVSKEINASNCRALEGGYMNTKGTTTIRKSSFYLTDAIAFEPFINEARFHNNLYMAQTNANQMGINLQEKAKEAGLMPYQYEYSKSLKKYSITIDLDRIGKDENYNDEADMEEKIDRVNVLLDAIKDLSLVVKGNLDNAEPILIVGGLGKRKTHYFDNVINVKDEKFVINEDLANKLTDDYRFGLLEGENFRNEKEIREIYNPINIVEFFTLLKEDVRDYYESTAH